MNQILANLKKAASGDVMQTKNTAYEKTKQTVNDYADDCHTSLFKQSTMVATSLAKPFSVAGASSNLPPITEPDTPEDDCSGGQSSFSFECQFSVDEMAST